MEPIREFPKIYRFNRIIRFTTIMIGLLAFSYAVWFILTMVNNETPFFMKVLPIIIILIAGQSLYSHISALQKIVFEKDCIIFSYMVRKKVVIPWDKITSLSMVMTRPKAVLIHYQAGEGTKVFSLLLAFPRMLEIMNMIRFQVPTATLDEYLDSVLINPEQK